MKVLIISHNPMSHKHSIGKTLLSFFSEFKKEELCQLYIHTGLPDSDVCSSFYRVTDKDVLKGVFSRRVKGGEVVAELPDRKIESNSNGFYGKLYASPKKRNPDRELFRDLMWSISPWYNKNLKSWIEAQKPTCIFAAIGSGKFLYDMAIHISRDYNLPLFTYVCDDFYSMEAQPTISGKLWKNLLVKKTQELMKQTNTIISICDELSHYYSNEFNTPALTIMTGTNYRVVDKPVDKEEVLNLRYFGKLSLNRYISMASICREIDRLNSRNDNQYSVDIYCGGTDEEIEKEYEDITCVKFHDFISGEEFDTTFFNSDALIHIEAFDYASIDRVKYSVSTKIADSLASGIPLFAFGPKQVASMQHLIRNQCAFIATSEDELPKQLQSLLVDRSKRLQISKNAISTAEKYHNPTKVSLQLHKILQDTK